MIFATKVGYWAVVPESTWTMFYFNSVSLLVFHQNNACQRTFFCERSEKRFPLSSAREPDWSGVKKEKEKKRKKKSNKKKKVALIRFPPLPPPLLNWIPISFKCDEYWQSMGVRLIIFMRGLFYKHGHPRNRLKISMLSNRLEFW